MTQAVLNNLSKIETIYSGNGDSLSGTTVPQDFKKILDNQTNNSEKELNSDTENTDNSESMLDVKSSVKPIQTLSEIISDAIEETVGETVLEGIVSTIGIDNIADKIVENTETAEDAVTEEVIPTDDNTTTIIIEDPTMNKEDLIYPSQLENAGLLALNNAINTNNKIQNNEDDTNIDSELNLKNENKTIQTMLKKFDINQTKEDKINIVSFVREDEEIPEPSLNQKNFVNEKVVKELNIESIESQTSMNNNSDNLMNNQTPQEQVIRAIIHGDIRFDDTAIKAFASAQEVTQTEVTSTKIIEQITKQLEGMYNSSKINMILNPEKLGKLSLQIINGKDGLSAQFTVTTNEARSLLLKGLDGLKETLLAHGVSVDNIDIKLNETEESNYNPDWTEQEKQNSGYRQGHPQKQKDEQKHFEQMMFELANDDKV